MAFYEYYRDSNNQKLLVSYADLTYQEHFHKGIEILFCKDGYIDVYLNKVKYVVKKDEAFFVDPGLTHKIDDFGKNKQNAFILIPVKYLSTYFDNVVGNIVNPVLPPKVAAPIFKIAESLMHKVSQTNELDLTAKIYEILGLVYRNCAFKEASPDTEINYDIIQKITDYVYKNYHEDITLDFLSAKFGYNKSYLSEILHRNLHVDFREYVNSIRLDMMVDNFNENDSIDGQIFSYGFKSRKTFYRTFEKYFHTTPKEYFTTRARSGARVRTGAPNSEKVKGKTKKEANGAELPRVADDKTALSEQAKEPVKELPFKEAEKKEHNAAHGSTAKNGSKKQP